MVSGCTITLLLTLATPYSLQQPNKSDVDLFQGYWKTVSHIVDGKDVTHLYHDHVAHFKGNVRSVRKGDKEILIATYRLNPLAMPKTIDITITGGDNKGQVLRGIYKFEGDVLVINCDIGQIRPTDFTCEKGSSRSLQKLKRIQER